MSIKYTDLHLYKPVQFINAQDKCFNSFIEAIKHTGPNLTWDLGAILSVISFGYVCGERTLVKEIKRQPWLSKKVNTKYILEDIPDHNFKYISKKQAAIQLHQKLYLEALRVIKNKKKVYILLSGGLDSRICACILNKIRNDLQINLDIIGITWGIKNSRDVRYSKEIAKRLNIEFHHIPISPDDIYINIKECNNIIGCMISPLHLHAMPKVKNFLKSGDLVIASSYGDSVGRAEYSGKHLLELNLLKPVNLYNILHSNLISVAQTRLQQDLDFLHRRSKNKMKHVLCEHEMQAHYTRSMLAHAMLVLNQETELYQMFTHPTVYKYMWSLHPAIRFNQIYAELLQEYYPSILRIPWARTGKALKGRSDVICMNSNKNFHKYRNWIFPIINKIYNNISWYSNIQLFDIDKIQYLLAKVKSGNYDYDAHFLIAWLECLRHFEKLLIQYNKTINIDTTDFLINKNKLYIEKIDHIHMNNFRLILSRSKLLTKIIRKIRRIYLRIYSIIKYLPTR